MRALPTLGANGRDRRSSRAPHRAARLFGVTAGPAAQPAGQFTIELADEHEAVFRLGAEDDRLPAQGALGELGAQTRSSSLEITFA